MTADQFYIYVTVVPATTMIIVLIGVLLHANTVNHCMNDLKGVFLASTLGGDSNQWDLGLQRLETMALEKFVELNNRLNRIESQLNLR